MDMSNIPSGCLGFLFGRRQGRYDVGFATAFPRVQVNKFFVSDAEANFFRVLRRVVGEQGHILAQVSLRQLLWMPRNNQTNPGRALLHHVRLGDYNYRDKCKKTAT